MKATVVLDVTIYRGENEADDLRLKHSVDFGDAVLDRQKESHELTADFAAGHHVDVKVGAQVTVNTDGQLAFAHVVVFHRQRAIGRMASWIPLKQTGSIAVDCEDLGMAIDCYLSLNPRPDQEAGSAAQSDRSEHGAS
jgi:hypothetical protein